MSIRITPSACKHADFWGLSQWVWGGAQEIAHLTISQVILLAWGHILKTLNEGAKYSKPERVAGWFSELLGEFRGTPSEVDNP